MVRINLLTPDAQSRRRGAHVLAPGGVRILATLLLLSTALSIACWSWWLRQRMRGLDAAIAVAEAEKQQLESVRQQAKDLDARGSELQRRIESIGEIRRRQVRPMLLLEELANATPPELWLVEIRQKDEELTLSGFTEDLSDVSDLVANLESSALVAAPVEIVDTETTADALTRTRVKFSLKATVRH